MRGSKCFKDGQWQLSRPCRTQTLQKGRKSKTLTQHRFFLKNAVGAIPERFLEPPADAHQEKGAKGPFFLSPGRAFCPCLATQKTQVNPQAGADKPRPCRFFPGFGFFGLRGSGRKEKTKQPPSCGQAIKAFYPYCASYHSADDRHRRPEMAFKLPERKNRYQSSFFS